MTTAQSQMIPIFPNQKQNPDVIIPEEFFSSYRKGLKPLVNQSLQNQINPIGQQEMPEKHLIMPSMNVHEGLNKMHDQQLQLQRGMPNAQGQINQKSFIQQFLPKQQPQRGPQSLKQIQQIVSDDPSSNVCEVIQPRNIQKPQAQSQQPLQKQQEQQRPQSLMAGSCNGVSSSAISMISTAASSHNPNFTQSQNLKTISVESSISQNQLNNTIHAPDSFIPSFQPKHMLQQKKTLAQKSIIEEVKTEDPYQTFANRSEIGKIEPIIEVNSHSENTCNIVNNQPSFKQLADPQLEVAQRKTSKKRVQFASQNESLGGSPSQETCTQTMTTSQTSCQTPQNEQRSQNQQSLQCAAPQQTQQLPKKKSFSEYKQQFQSQYNGMTYNQLEKLKEQEELKHKKNQPKVPQPGESIFQTQRPPQSDNVQSYQPPPQKLKSGSNKAVDQVQNGIDQALQNRKSNQNLSEIAQQEQEWLQEQNHQQKIQQQVQNQQLSNIRRNNSVSADFGRVENDRDSGGDGLEIVNAPLTDFQTISGKNNLNQEEYPKPPPSKYQKLEIEQDCEREQNKQRNTQYEKYLKYQEQKSYQPQKSQCFNGTQPQHPDFYQREQVIGREQEAQINLPQQQKFAQNSRYGGQDPQEYGDYTRQPNFDQNQGVSQADEKKLKNEKWLESFKSAPGSLDLKSSYDRNQFQQTSRPQQNIDIRQPQQGFDKNQCKTRLNKFFDSCKMDTTNSNQILSNRNTLDGGGMNKSNNGSPEKSSTANSSARKITLKARDDTPSQGTGGKGGNKDPNILRWFMGPGGRLIPVRRDGRTSSSSSPAQKPVIKFS